MTIDLARIHSIESQYAALDPMEAYYRQRVISFETIGPLVPSTRPLLRQALDGRHCVLDIGCGNGETLLDCAQLVDNGVGFDESQYIIKQAGKSARRQNAGNIAFSCGKAVALPFRDSSFDFVWSERGPLGHNDATLKEALRVLQPGGRIFVETLFWPDPGKTLLSDLEVERQRFGRLGVELELLTSRVRHDRYQDVYAWFEVQCVIWRYQHLSPPFPYSSETLQAIVSEAGGDDRPFSRPNYTMWIGGVLT
jgi:SAM-dependent methyltransferase